MIHQVYWVISCSRCAESYHTTRALIIQQVYWVIPCSKCIGSYHTAGVLDHIIQHVHWSYSRCIRSYHAVGALGHVIQQVYWVISYNTWINHTAGVLGHIMQQVYWVILAQRRWRKNRHHMIESELYSLLNKIRAGLVLGKCNLKRLTQHCQRILANHDLKRERWKKNGTAILHSSSTPFSSRPLNNNVLGWGHDLCAGFSWSLFHHTFRQDSRCLLSGYFGTFVFEQARRCRNVGHIE